jgi:tetratricopeptide (TPR) repeat protein/predicted aspartyl protease
MEIPVRIVDQRPIATLSLNGTEVPMLVDSGAFFSLLSASTASQLQLPLSRLPVGLEIHGYTGRVDARLTRVEKVGLLKTELQNVEFIVGGNEIGAGIMGVLGRNILSMADTEYDLAHGAVRLSFPKGDCAKTDFAHWAGAAPVVVVPLEADDPDGETAIGLKVGINGTRTLAVLDTGAPQTSLTLKAARRAGIEQSDLQPYGHASGVGEGRVKTWTAPVALFELGGEKIANNRLEIDDNSRADFGMLLGLDYFLSHRIYVSRLQGQVYLTWNGGPVFALGRATPGEPDSRYAARPADVDQDDADALARRGAAAIAAANYPLALADLNRACELAPTVADYFFARARLHLTLRQTAAALADFDQALRLQPELAEARMRRARLRSAAGDRPGAQADLAQLDAALAPSSPLRADMAAFYANFNQATEALRQFDLWVSSHPNDRRLAGVLNDRCWLRARFNIDLPLALKDCEQAVDLDGSEPNSHDSLGWTWLRLGDASKAKRAFDGAIALQPRAYALYGRGLAHLRLDDSSSGERDLAAARKLKPAIDETVRQDGFEFADGVKRAPAAGS